MGCGSSKVSNLQINYEELNIRGIAYLLQENLEAAHEDFSKAISIKPKAAKAYFNRAMIYYKQDKIEALFDDLVRAFKLNPQLAINTDPRILKKLFESSEPLYHQLKKYLSFSQRLAVCYEGEAPEHYEDLYDPITNTLMDEPVALPSGHTYDRKTIENWFEQQGNPAQTTCPLSRQLINYDDFQKIQVHLNTKRRIEQFIKAQEENGRAKIEQKKRDELSKQALLRQARFNEIAHARPEGASFEAVSSSPAKTKDMK